MKKKNFMVFSMVIIAFVRTKVKNVRTFCRDKKCYIFIARYSAFYTYCPNSA